METKSEEIRENALAKVTAVFVRLFERWMPDAFVVALVLTLITFASAVIFTASGPLDVVGYWGDGFWNLLTFTNQIVLTLLFGHALAHTNLVHAVLRNVASIVRSPRGAYMLVCFIGGVTALLSWALSLVAGAIMARTTARVCAEKGIKVDYPLLVASAYSGFVIWHQGLSSSIGLAIATPGHFLEDRIGVIPVAQTLFAPANIIVALFVLITLPVVMSAIRPRKEHVRELKPVKAEPKEEDDPIAQHFGPAARLENARWLNWLIVLGGLVFLWVEFVERGNGLNLNLLNFLFLIFGLILARSPLHYVQLITNAAKVAAPFLLQYPFYAGIAGIMAASGLAKLIVDLFVSVASPDTLPLFTFFSAALLNIFIPSGGGQWAVQGPIAMESAIQIGADQARVAFAVMLGDQWTNLIQPLVTIPALAIAGLHVRDIMGFCAIALFYTGFVFVVSLLIL